MWNSYLNTANVKFHYCVPDDYLYGRCVVGDPGFDTNDGADTDVDTTTNDGWCPVDTWGCTSCAYGYYKQSFGHPCECHVCHVMMYLMVNVKVVLIGKDVLNVLMDTLSHGMLIAEHIFVYKVTN